MITDLIAELNRRYERWSFKGDLVEWQRTGGQWLVRKMEVVTPTGPDSFVFGGRRIYVRQGEPTGDNPQMPIPVKRPATSAPRPDRKPKPATVCQHRGDQIRTMTSDLCGTRGHNLPVYSCELHRECTFGKVCRGQDAAVRICVGCEDGPWAFT